MPTTKSGYFKFSQKLNFGKELALEDQTRLWFPLSVKRGAFLYAHALDDKVKIHYDHGFVDAAGYALNLYGSLNFRKDLSDKNIKVGVSHNNKRVYTNTRLRVTDQNVAAIYHKTQLRFKEWKFGFQGVVDLSRRSLVKKDLVLGYENPDFSVYLQGHQIWDRPTNNYNNWREFFNHVSLTGLFRRGLKELYGVEAIADPLGNAITSVSGLVDYQQGSHSRLKLKLNHRLLASFVLERVINPHVTVSIGAQLPLHPRNENKEKRQTKVGLKFAFNL